NARTPQQNGVAERMNRTLIKAARTMLANSLLPTTFWAEAVSTACCIFNRIRVTKPQNKTPYELLFGHKPIISYIRPFVNVKTAITPMETKVALTKYEEAVDVDVHLYRSMIGTDKSKITRKQSKASKHGHKNQKSTKPKPKKPSLSQSLSQFSSPRAILAFLESYL
ncbi:retrovirus-related pol polyprotein from transposon TNT 1-94, partial [Tanacetum coccineum]